MSGMARLKYGRLSEAWKGEASDFTPLLAEQVDALGSAIGVDLATIGKSEVVTSGNRRIDILATDSEGSEFVIENQYRGLDHDHLTRGLAYAVARRARGLVVVAEEHRDEFRALAQYLNDLAELDTDRGVSVWLVEAKAVQIEDSPWAPLFDVVVEPNSFTTVVEQTKQAETALPSLDELLLMIESDTVLKAVQEVIEAWGEMGHRRRLGPNHIVLEARGPSKAGFRTVVAIYADGRVMVPFGSYAGQNSGIEIAPLTTAQFRADADALFGFAGSEKLARTTAGWLTPERTTPLLAFCTTVADAYKAALDTVPDASI